jgi:uncharacterized glyoxalase superfamily protein PhnB
MSSKVQEVKLGYVIVYVANVEETVRFYERAFGLTRRFVHESGEYAELETGATALAFANEQASTITHAFTRNRAGATPAGVEVALVSDDPRAAFVRATAAGAVSVLEPTEKPWGQTISYVRDLNGFVVELCSPVRQ